MISEKEYASRRKRVAKELKNNSIAVIFAADNKVRSNDTNYPYRQNSNFYYLSGFREDSSALVIVKGKKSFESFLFVHKKDPKEELWNGKRLGVKEAKKRFQVDDVFEYDTLNAKLKELMQNKKALYYDFSLEYSKVKVLKRYTKSFVAIYNLSHIVQKMRLIKSPAEIALIKHAMTITKEAHHQAMQKASSLNYEYELQAEIEYVFKKNGAYSDAYTSIVACGDNANTLHYINNDAKLQKKQLILIDAGCEYQYYASDITRTIPSDGSFTQPQKELYNGVLSVQKQIIQMIRPGVLRSQLQKKSQELLCQVLKKLGIIQAGKKKCMKKELFKKYYPHGIGHWMGLDVHDEAPYKDEKNKEIPLQEGMVLTIEPALYIAHDDTNVAKKYRGIGIRIEDDILITATGYENLSCDIVKEIDEIEALASSH